MMLISSATIGLRAIYVKRYCVQVQDSADAILVIQVMRVHESWRIDRLVEGL